jgi:RES domain-containing protein
MNLYRVTNFEYAGNFNGRGASFIDGARWNSAGRPVIYFAMNMAAALVEAANYHPSPRLMPKSHCKAIYELEDTVSIDRLDWSALPADWQEMPYPVSTQLIGDAFLDSGKALLLLLPSVAVGLNDYSIAIANPQHEDMKKIKLIDTIKPVYSGRMFSGI